MNIFLSSLLILSIIATVYVQGLVECPPSDDGLERFSCPTPDDKGRFHCIDDYVVCDGNKDCPNGDDEDPLSCFYKKITDMQLNILADAVLRLTPRS